MKRILKTTFEVFEDIAQLAILFIAAYLYVVSI